MIRDDRTLFSEIRCDLCLETTNLKQCSRCRSVRYCSIKCQKEDWPKHKTVCPTLVKRQLEFQEATQPIDLTKIQPPEIQRASPVAVKIASLFQDLKGGNITKGEFDEQWCQATTTLENDPYQKIRILESIIPFVKEKKIIFTQLYIDYMKIRQFKKGTGCASQVIEHDPEDPIGFYYRGLAFELRRKDEKAQKDFEEALSKASIDSPLRRDLLVSLGEVCCSQNNPLKALEHAEEVLEKDPNHMGALNLKAEVLISCEEKQDHSAALEILDRSIESNQSSDRLLEAHQKKATLYAHQGKLELALREIEICEALSPGNPDIEMVREAILKPEEFFHAT